MAELIWVLEHLHILILMTMKVSEGNTFLPSFCPHFDSLMVNMGSREFTRFDTDGYESVGS